MKKLIIGIFSLFSLLAQAQIQVDVQPSQIALGESFQLILTQDNTQGGGQPDMSALQQDFSIIGTERSMEYSIINGVSKTSNKWIISLQAKKAGTVTIPAIKIGNDQTSPVTINISSATKSTNIQNNSSQDLMLTVDVSERKPYVNQQITYTVKLYNRKRLLDTNYQEAHVKDALLIPLGDLKRYQTTQNNSEYLVEEQDYAIYPQKSGTLTITPPVFSALVYDFNPQRVQVSDKPVSINVQPIPATYKGSTWLPARQLRLFDQYENPSQSMSLGSTLVRTVTIEGVALPAQLFPSLEFASSKEFSVYPEKGTERNQVKQGELTGRRTMKITYLFKEAGKITIPEVKLSWFNTDTGKEEVALLPPRTIEITGPAGTVNDSNVKPLSLSNTMASALESKNPEAPVEQASYSWAWILAGFCAFAWLITLALWFWQRKKPQLGKGQYKKALEAVDKACSSNNPIKTRDALLKWAAVHWPDAPILNLSDISILVRDLHLKKQLNQLSQALYKTEEKSTWTGAELAQVIKSLSQAKKPIPKKVKPLPPINPEL